MTKSYCNLIYYSCKITRTTLLLVLYIVIPYNGIGDCTSLPWHERLFPCIILLMSVYLGYIMKDCSFMFSNCKSRYLLSIYANIKSK